MIKCPNCGGELKFSPKDKVVHCDYCDSNFKPDELKREAKSAKEVKTIEANSYRCRECGAELLTFDDTAITFCSYCGSQAMLDAKMVKINNPDYVIPFTLTKEDCIAAYKAKLNKALFAPSYMKKDFVVEKFRGIYMPYCIYKVAHHGKTISRGHKYEKRVGNYDYYGDYEISGDVDATYDGLSYDVISKLYDKYTHSIPYNFKEAKEFNLNYLIGYYADSMDVKNNIYDGEAIAIARGDAVKEMRKDKIFAKYGCLNPTINPYIESRKIGMFPLYFLSIRNKDDKHIYYAVVNGQTGKIAMDLPIDYKKYFLFSLILAVPIFFLLNGISSALMSLPGGLILLPKGILAFSILVSIVVLVFSISQIKEIANNENHYYDIGYNSVNKTENESTSNVVTLNKKTSKITTLNKKKLITKETKKFIYKPIIGIVIAVLIYIISPADDIYYYCGSIVNFLLIVWSSLDLIKEHNMLSTNKLPQFEKRGGDEK